MMTKEEVEARLIEAADIEYRLDIGQSGPSQRIERIERAVRAAPNGSFPQLPVRDRFRR